MSQAVVRGFFDAWNRRDMDAAMALVAEDCVFDDHSFPAAHVGRTAIRTVLERLAGRNPELRFAIDATTGEQDVGILWHTSVAGQIGPRGISYARCNADGQLCWLLDAQEPPEKLASRTAG